MQANNCHKGSWATFWDRWRLKDALPLKSRQTRQPHANIVRGLLYWRIKTKQNETQKALVTLLYILPSDSAKHIIGVFKLKNNQMNDSRPEHHPHKLLLCEFYPLYNLPNQAVKVFSETSAMIYTQQMICICFHKIRKLCSLVHTPLYVETFWTSPLYLKNI